MKTKLAMLGMATTVAATLAVTGCSAAEMGDISTTTSENLTGGAETGVWKPVPTKPNAEVVVHAEHTYAGDLATKCGPGYAVDLVVDFGTVTTETLGIDRVTAFYLPKAGNVVVPRRLDTWTRQGAARDVAIDSGARGPGERVRYEVKHEYRLDPTDPIVVLELASAGGVAPADPACAHVARFVFYPVIPR